MRRLTWLTLLLACNPSDPVDTTEPITTVPPGTTGDPGTSTGTSTSTGAPTTGGETGTDSSSGGETTAGVVTTGGSSTGPADASSSTGLPGDADADGVLDDEDNCVDDANPDQSDNDSDGAGDVCDPDDDDDGVPDDGDVCPLVPDPQQDDQDGDGEGDLCDDDLDGDFIPNDDDVFPDDPDKPGKAQAAKMYAHSATTLSTIDVVTYDVVTVGDFVWPMGLADSMTDIAIDRHGQLFGISFTQMYVCDPMTAECWNLGTIPGEYNGLTFLPAGTLLPDKDALIAITVDGNWYHLTIQDAMVMVKAIGKYGGTYSSAGDAFSIENVGTFAAVYKAGVPTTVIVTVDPLTGTVLSDLAVLPLSTVWGLAGWQGAILAFDYTGDVAKVDPVTKEITLLGNKGSEWWGAGVSTVLPQ
jgi:hypothetical protein